MTEQSVVGRVVTPVRSSVRLEVTLSDWTASESVYIYGYLVGFVNDRAELIPAKILRYFQHPSVVFTEAMTRYIAHYHLRCQIWGMTVGILPSTLS